MAGMNATTKAAAIMLLGLSLMGCASSYDDGDNIQASNIETSSLPSETGQNHALEQAGQTPLQCVPYAREHSQVKLYGDAYTWWDQAAGKYERGKAPATGAVMVLFDYAGPEHGHLAVVKRIVSAREIRVDHANWLDDGSIYVNDPVVDVSANNDWSAIKVWNIKTGGWGVKIYPVRGFIGSGNVSVADASDVASQKNGPVPDAVIARAEPLPQRDSKILKATEPLVQTAPDPESHALTADDLAIP
jgi:surface antigen